MIYYQWSDWLEARRDLVIDDIRPRTSAAGFEFFDTKVNFFYGFPGGRSFRTTNLVTTLAVHVRDQPDELTVGCDPSRSVDTWVR